jgi:hypothetical protein
MAKLKETLKGLFWLAALFLFFNYLFSMKLDPTGSSDAASTAPSAPTPLAQGDSITFDPEESRKARMFSEAISNAEVCVSNSLRVSLNMGMRKRDDLAQAAVNLCIYKLAPTYSIIGRPVGEARAYLLATAYGYLERM